MNAPPSLGGPNTKLFLAALLATATVYGAYSLGTRNPRQSMTDLPT